MFREFLEAYINTCNEIVTRPANSAMAFEAGERAATVIKAVNFEDIKKAFQQEGIEVSFDINQVGILFSVIGMPIKEGEFAYCDLFRGFFGEVAKRFIDSKFQSRKRIECRVESDNKCVVFIEV